MESSVLSLYELNHVIKNAMSDMFSGMFWIRAETSDVRENHNGHCYLEFIQKDEKNKNLIAKARGVVWSNVYQMLKLYFESETGQLFTSGLKVLVLVSVEFHELYGFSLNVHNIDPSYTLGDQARNRTEIIRKLKEEGVLTLNKELEFSPVPNRIAIISSPTAAGYEDFCSQLSNNKQSFVFYTHLFPSIMQGERAEESILASLYAIDDNRDCFDAVVIIRGGGASSDLSCFDSYLLAASCSQFPLPIITGIGHERDDTVLDVVAHARVKTPTAAAEYILNKMTESAEHLAMLETELAIESKDALDKMKLELESLTMYFSHLITSKTKEQISVLDSIESKLGVAVSNFIKEKVHVLNMMEQHIELVSPQNILKKGYTLTMKDNKIIKSASCLRKGENITTVFQDGSIDSTIY